MLDRLKSNYRALRDGQPGHRFRDFADERRKRRSGKMTVGRVVTFVSGLLLIVVGIGIGWLPGPGGFVAFLGLAMIAQEIPWIADMLDGMETIIRKVIRSMKNLITSRHQ